MNHTACERRFLFCGVPLLAALLMSVACFGNMASAEVYSDSAHGDTSTGVMREGTSYPQGNCTHCHDSYDGSICGVNELMLFAPNNPTSQTDNFCFQCHKTEPDSVQDSMVANNEYSATFGGGTVMFESIYDAVNPASTVDFPFPSSHGLSAVQSYAGSRSWGGWMTADTNACLVCHDQHLSQKNFPVLASGYGGVQTAVRKSNDVNSYPGNLWGDEPYSVSGRNEMMSDWVSGYVYQAPYRVGGTTYEPAGDATADGSNLPNYVDACAETCHREDIDAENGPIAVNWTLSSSPTWPGTPSFHGRKAADNSPGDWGWLKPPYSESLRGSYVLACTDCHEPHGSPNATTLRRTVNGVTIPPTTFPDPRPQGYEDVDIGDSTGAQGWVYPDGAFWYNWCSACHDLTFNPQTMEGHIAAWEYARCGDNVGCHLFHTPDEGMPPPPGGVGPSGDHGYWF
ncbi:MAG: hypothetical protein SWQ30_22065 [Thermodesulfobacteriota bacterium]|nr:hypothetical protein [Thermodesulfobacteriota bacterium]